MGKKKTNLLLSIIYKIRKELTVLKIQREEKRFARYSPVSIGETSKLEIIPLYEAISEGGLECGYGVSYLIKTDKSVILYDMGHNPKALSPSPLEQNMSRLGIALGGIDIFVLSHRHPDHVGGMYWWQRKSFSINGKTQPSLGRLPMYVPEKIAYPGSQPVHIQVPTVIAEGIATTGGFSFFEDYPLWKVTPDDTEQTLVINAAGKGLVLVVGCGHMGLDRLLRRVKQVFNLPVAGIVGGLHYGRATAEDLKPEIDQLKAACPKLVSVSPHDSYPEAVQAFADSFADVYKPIRVGVPIVLP